MIERLLKVTTGESIYIYDDIFGPDELFSFKSFAEKSNYKVLADTVSAHDFNDNTLFRCFFVNSDIDNFGIFNSPRFTPIYEKHFKERKNVINWIVVSNPGTKNYFHPDGTRIDLKSDVVTILFYINLKWDINGGGETLFCNSEGEVEIAVSFKPNRMVVFPSYLLHKASTQDIDMKELRYVLVSKWARIDC